MFPGILQGLGLSLLSNSNSSLGEWPTMIGQDLEEQDQEVVAWEELQILVDNPPVEQAIEQIVHPSLM